MSTQGEDKVDFGGLAAILDTRLATQARIARASAFVWSCGGLAAALSLSACGLAIAFWGYSHMLSIKPAAEQIAKALVDGLERAELKTTVSGNMSIAPESELKLATGQALKLDENAVIRLHPNSSVRVVGDLKVEMPQPSRQQLQLDTTTRTNELPFTSYTLFRSVGYASGRVETGWSFDLADTTRPKRQFCSYIQNIGQGVSAKYVIAIDAAPHKPSPLAKLSFNFESAVTNCIWFSGA